MTSRIITCLLPVVLALIGQSGKRPPQDNHPPIVKLVSPANNTSINPGSQLAYEISVADKEDGDTRFGEINPKEVLLEARYFANRAALHAFMAKPVPNDPPGLAVMLRSGCFNCHDFKGGAMGPSFADMGRRYPHTALAADTLATRIKDGSTGIWGKEKMPSHPELTADEINSVVRWILQYATTRNVDFYVGTSGIFKVPEDRPGAFALTASYTDHGLKDLPGIRLRGVDRVVVTSSRYR
jgi:cytochrome c